MKRLLFSVLFSALAFILVCGSNRPVQAAAYISIATGGTAGTYYPIGGAIAKAVSTDPDIKATAETGNASVANTNLLGRGGIEVAFVQNDIAFWAYNGQMMFKTPLKNLRVITALYPEHVQLIVDKNAGINALNDLAGKRVGVGAQGSGVEGDVRALFQVAKLGYEQMKINFLDFAATTDRFKNNQLDAGFVVAGYPTASIMDLAATKEINLVDFSKEFLSELSAAHPYFVSSVIPAGTYSGIDKDIHTPAVMALLLTHDKVPDETIYAFTKALFANLDIVHASHAKGKEINLQSALEGLTTPLHPGAARFFKEQGCKLD